MTRDRISHAIAVASLLALIALCLSWETWLSPLRPGGSWLMLKVLPLLLPLPGLLRGNAYTCKWASMLILVYFAEGTVRAWSDRDDSALLGAAEAALAGAFFSSCIVFVRARRS